MRMRFIFYSLCAGLLAACADNTSQVTAGNEPAAAIAEAGIDLTGTDSIELLYYPDPAQQRQYKRLVVTDSAIIRQLRQDIEQDPVGRKECPHPVKLYWIRKGEVFKTVYANTTDSCGYFAYAVGSRPYFTSMNAEAKNVLDSLVQAAR